MTTAPTRPVTADPIAAGVLHCSAALHHLQQLAAADAQLNGSQEREIAAMVAELEQLALGWEQLAEGRRMGRVARLLGIDAAD